MQIVQDHVIDILEIVRKSRKIGVGRYTSIPIFTLPDPNEFQSFLIKNRIIPILMMKMLYNTAHEYPWLIGHGKISYSERLEVPTADVPKKEEIIVNPSIVNNEFSWEQVFDALLHKLGLGQLESHDHSILDFQERKTGHGLVQFNPLQYHEKLEMPVFVYLSNPIVALSADRLYFDAKYPKSIDPFTSIIVLHKEFFDTFLQAHRHRSVDHEMYLSWIMSWFSDMISIRQIE